MHVKVRIVIFFSILLSIVGGIGLLKSRTNYGIDGNPVKALQGNIIFNETFEGNKPFSMAHKIEAGKWNYALQYVNDPVFEGKRAVRFEIHKDQELVSNGKRCEAVIIKGLPSREMWYSFAVFFPSHGFERDTQRELFNQWYQKGSPATSLRVRNDAVYLESGNTKESREEISIAPLVKDVWHEFVLHFVHSYGDEGLIEVWYDNQKVITRHGGNMYDDVLPKWKIGIYKTAFTSNQSLVNSRVLYFDNVKVGNEKSSYEAMKPGVD